MIIMESPRLRGLVLSQPPLQRPPLMDSSSRESLYMWYMKIRNYSRREVVKAANGVSNMVLAHEIAVNKDFVLSNEPPENSLEHQVKAIVHQAFWDILQEQLNQTPPCYDQALNLLGEIKKMLLEQILVQPGSQRKIRTEITEILDLPLIKQQLDHGVLDFLYYARWLVSLLARLVAPVHDDRVKELGQETEVVPLFRGIMKVLELTKIDMANYTLQTIRPQVQLNSIEYERQKFQEFLEIQAELMVMDPKDIPGKSSAQRSGSQPTTPSAATVNGFLFQGVPEKNAPMAPILAKVQPHQRVQVTKRGSGIFWNTRSRAIVHQAFWDILQEQLNQTPPCYDQALNLLGEIKKMLLEQILVQPGSQRKIRTEITEILDLPLIKQQLDHGVLDFLYYARWLVSLLARLVAPVHDDRVKELGQETEVVPLFRGIMKVLELTKIDMANYTLQTIRPQVQLNSIEYERQKFQEFLEIQAGSLVVMASARKGPIHLHVNARPHVSMITRQKLNELGYETLDHPPYSPDLSPTDYHFFKHLANFLDPNFDKTSPIDLVIGADLAPFLYTGKLRFQNHPGPTACSSKLGWILSGNVSSSETGNNYISLCSTSQGDDNLRQFFELESVPAALPLTKEEKSCGDIYDKNFCISTDGRYSVGLPFKSVPNLGDSRQNAMKRFLALERKLHKSSNLLQQYKDFMMEYLSLNHMELIPKNERDKPSDKCYYIPHHCVLREQSSTTKLRVVFDASCKTSNNYSLNDFLHTGPKLQHDIFNILVKFRTNPIAFTGDIEKMYRQIKVNSSDLDFQRIFWRNSPSESLLEYRLLTVTYGMSCAPYLAIRTLMQLATDKELLFPEASKIIKTDFYVDDLLSGATTIEEAKVLIDDIRKILLSGGFCIRKWMSNVPEVLSEVPEALKAHDSYEIGDNSSVKILGINWNPSTDNFTITVNSLKDVYSKRQLLSDISRIYDPLGWLSPVIISFKILFQTLWKQDLDWDDPLSESLCSHWRRVKMDLAMLNHIKIPRYISCKGLIHSLELHGFCDASESAYSSVVYMKSRFKSGHVQVTLIAAKTKVAPLKATSIPRLELCAALLLSNLYDSIYSSLLLQIDRVMLWTDSQIVLCWIKSESKHWKPFVGNRIAEIQRLTLQSSWYYVSTKDNPADCASRGITSSELVNHSLWWNGPDWLSNSSLQDPLPITYELPKEVCHEKRKTVPIVHFTTCPIIDFIFKFSTFRKLSRVTAWLLRFIHNAKHRSDKIKHKELSSNELDNSIRTLIQIIQSSEFKTEIQCCNQSKVLPSNSKLLSLNPFIDSSGILRVGGRLRKSNLQFNEKHPIILPHNHFVTELIVQQFHVEHLHSSLQLTLCAIRQKYWIPSGRILVKKLINRCMTCFKTKRQVSKQIMGDLPIHRIIPSSPFSKTGIDFAGPFITKPNVIRTKVTLKSYIALFICFSTKAIHLEIVSDLSTPAFLAAFRRFISRRGKPSDIFTDNATNFKGAKNILNNIHQLVKDSSIQNYVANEHITWHFIPPSAPNFGGIWEAGIKSLKYHLLRCLKSAVLNFEELNTLTSQIEACLNSRLLYPMSSDPNDFNPLTPGHFLIGRPLTALPEPSYHPNDNYLTRWKLIQKARDVLWQRWSREYLNNLQQRSKWKKPSSNLKVGDLVLVKDFPMPSLQWSLGRITKVSPGADGNVRVVELQTEKQHHLIRPISKIALLPF
ncbi:hypothetical protein LAZ67_18002516 [Cordylochernes scorpioides]|uniref:Integrase catalytic domain-containing protein n=1 Tax=Cordylochernes scorpioides TaxID=51811 RepID=A0ABY6LKD5_9ARAC|nr:hypothetical protein LAZ67_18002516 [Cordylochernes scorpioides]